MRRNQSDDSLAARADQLKATAMAKVYQFFSSCVRAVVDALKGK